jgi:hypothetical protein
MEYDPHERSVPELLRDWGTIMGELRAREIIRTNNNPVGDLAEAIVAEYYHGKRGSFSQAGWDVKTESGDLIQVKALRHGPGSHRRNLSPIRDTGYSHVVIAIFDESFRVLDGLRLSRALVEKLFPTLAYVNGRIITVTQSLSENREVEHLDLRAAAEHLGRSVPAE